MHVQSLSIKVNHTHSFLRYPTITWQHFSIPQRLHLLNSTGISACSPIVQFSTLPWGSLQYTPTDYLTLSGRSYNESYLPRFLPIWIRKWQEMALWVAFVSFIIWWVSVLQQATGEKVLLIFNIKELILSQQKTIGTGSRNFLNS